MLHVLKRASLQSITTGTSQSISVLTDPPGASCTLTRDGGVVGIDAASEALTCDSAADVTVSLPPEVVAAAPLVAGSAVERATCEQSAASLKRERGAELARLSAPGLAT